MSIIVHGYRYSVYSRVLRMVLVAKGLEAEWVETDPFGPMPGSYTKLHPFGRVPVLEHGDFIIYETAAICRYLDEGFEGPSLQPGGYTRRARMTQIISIIDNYGYQPMVRQVYAKAVFAPAKGEPIQDWQVQAGLEASHKVLTALEPLIVPQSATEISLADLHLAAMVDAFVAAPEGARMLAGFPRLSRWWDIMRDSDPVKKTRDSLLVRVSYDSLS